MIKSFGQKVITSFLTGQAKTATTKHTKKREEKKTLFFALCGRGGE